MSCPRGWAAAAALAEAVAAAAAAGAVAFAAARCTLRLPPRCGAEARGGGGDGVVPSCGLLGAALEAAEASSQSALDANKLGYQVGVRINIDVLNAQSQLFQTKRDLAKARYDVLVGGLRLRLANGSLKPEDVQAINSLLVK